MTFRSSPFSRRNERTTGTTSRSYAARHLFIGRQVQFQDSMVGNVALLRVELRQLPPLRNILVDDQQQLIRLKRRGEVNRHEAQSKREQAKNPPAPSNRFPAPRIAFCHSHSRPTYPHPSQTSHPSR